MRFGLIASSVCFLIVAGCASQKPSDTWACDESPSGAYRCEQTGDAGTEEVIQEVDDSSSQEASDEGRYVILDRREDRWQKHLPSLTQGSSDYQVVVADKPKQHELRPRQPDVFKGNVATVEGLPAEGGGPALTSGVSSYQSALIQQFREPVKKSQPTVEPDSDAGSTVMEQPKPHDQTLQPDRGLARAYTVQLGAFTSEQEMRAYAEQKNLRHLDNLLGHRTRMKGRDWYVITWGRFDSRQQATQEWLKQQASYPGVEYWVRTVHSLQQAKIQEN